MAVHYGARATVYGRPRRGDVRFMQAMVGAFVPETADDDAVAQALLTAARARELPDIAPTVHEMLLMPGGRSSTGTFDLEQAIEQLNALASTPWLSDTLNAPVTPPPAPTITTPRPAADIDALTPTNRLILRLIQVGVFVAVFAALMYFVGV